MADSWAESAWNWSSGLAEWFVGLPCLFLGLETWFVGPPCPFVGLESWFVGPLCIFVGLESWFIGLARWFVGLESWVVGLPCLFIELPASGSIPRLNIPPRSLGIGLLLGTFSAVLAARMFVKALELSVSGMFVLVFGMLVRTGTVFGMFVGAFGSVPSLRSLKVASRRSPLGMFPGCFRAFDTFSS